MIKYVYATKNKKSGNFHDPSFEVFPKDNAAEVYTVSAKEAPVQNHEVLKENEVYYIGTFDTKTGVLTPDIEFIIDLGSVLSDNGTKVD